MRFYKNTSELQTPDKIYVVTSCDEWDSWDVSYHKTKKGAYKWIIDNNYDLWTKCRYIANEEYHYYVSEKLLNE